MTDAKKRQKVTRPQYGQAGARTRSNRSATLGTLSQRPSMLIVCEGAKTETNYFKAFKVTDAVYGKGLNTRSLVLEAERRNTKEGPFKQVWCVFDRDSFPPDDFDNAIELAKSKGFHVAYSNQAFELWFLLHFSYVDTALHRSQFEEKLEPHLGRTYKKDDSEIYKLLQDRGDEDKAIKRAEQLRRFHPTDLPCSQRNPETTVDLLVQELRKALKQRGY